MANVHGLMLLILITIFSYTANVRASVQDFSGQSPYFRDSSGNWHKSTAFNAQLAAGKLTYDGQFRVESPSTGKTYPLTLTRSVAVNLPRLGTTVSNLAKVTSPIGLGITAASLICELSDICDDGNGEWLKAGDPAFAEYPTTVPNTGSRWSGQNNVYFPTAQLSCSDCARLTAHVGPCNDWSYDSHVFLSGSTWNCKARRNSDGAVFSAGNTVVSNGCPNNYTASGSQCNLDSQSSPPTTSDWDNASSSLADVGFVEPLMSMGKNIPIDTPDPIDPVNYVSGERTITNRDSNGNITGTTVETTTLTLTDASTESAPNQFDVKESKTVINYDINNNIIDQSTTITEGPPSVPPPSDPTDEDFEFDDMTDEDLDEWEMPDVFDWESWGDGSCPANRFIDYSYGSLELSYEPACTFAQDVRPIILIVAGIIAMFIISGVRTD